VLPRVVLLSTIPATNASESLIHASRPLTHQTGSSRTKISARTIKKFPDPSPSALLSSAPPAPIQPSSVLRTSPSAAMPSPMSQHSHVSALPTGYRFAMASVIDDAKKKGTEAKYVSSVPLPIVAVVSLLSPFNCVYGLFCLGLLVD
jgi:hypothetical protein